VAWTNPRVDLCYGCLPGGPFTPPVCRGCGSSEEYYSQGLCRRCHHYAPQHLESCNHCLAWGVIRKYKWMCWRCLSWRTRFERGTCRHCGRENLPVNPDQRCNLCDRQTAIALGATPDEANAHGQQLYLANIPWAPSRATKDGRTRHNLPAAPKPRQRPDRPVTWLPREDHQLTLFDMPRDLGAAHAKADLDGGFGDPPDPDMAAFLDYQVRDHAHRHGWSKTSTHRAQKSMRVLQHMQDTPGVMLRASDAMRLHDIGLAALPIIDIATAVGVMVDDREPAIHRWFATTIAGLPAPMKAELGDWFDTMLNGSTTPPRRRPRGQETTRQYLRGAMPALTDWAGQGHTSLREITHAQVLDVLPPSGNPRSIMGAGLRSIFTLLKARKILFTNPIARVRTGAHERRQPLPLDTASIQTALDSPDPACAAITALAAFHGVRTRDIRHMQLTDLADGRLRIDQPTDKRTILLAAPVQIRLAAWLDHRTRRWPNTANPYVFINHRNAGKLDPVGFHWVSRTMDLPVSVIRDDRILHEINATGGDLRRICELFGIKVETALRYLPTPDLDDPGPPDDTRQHPSSRTQGHGPGL